MPECKNPRIRACNCTRACLYVEPFPATYAEAPPPWEVMPANPKQAYGDTKVPLHLFPYTAIAGGAMAFVEGKGKYGGDNFRAAKVEAMTYVGALDRHMKAWAEGQDIDEESGLPHLFKAVACVAILIDAHYAGSLIDNRKFPGGYHKLMAEMEPMVATLRDRHKDKNPKHYTIADAKKEG